MEPAFIAIIIAALVGYLIGRMHDTKRVNDLLIENEGLHEFNQVLVDTIAKKEVVG